MSITIPRAPVKSSNIASIGYSAEHRMLDVDFGKSVYRYFDVPADVHAKMAGAESIGKFFASDVRGKFKTEKIA